MPRPRNLTELRAFIGLINYYGRFIKNLSNLQPLNTLLKKEVTFIWTKECELAFNRAKREFKSEKILPVTTKDVRLETRKDNSLNKLLRALEKGKSVIPLGYKDNEFSLQKGIIFRKDRVVIPKTITSKILHAYKKNCTRDILVMLK